MELGQGRGIAAAQRGEHGTLGERSRLRSIVQVRAYRIAAAGPGPPTTPALAAGHAERGLSVLFLYRLLDLVAAHAFTPPLSTNLDV